MIEPNKKQLKTMRLYWEKLLRIETVFLNRVYDLEKELSREIGIKEIEFFRCDGDYVGIGNADRTMNLINEEKLRKQK